MNYHGYRLPPHELGMTKKQLRKEKREKSRREFNETLARNINANDQARKNRPHVIEWWEALLLIVFFPIGLLVQLCKLQK